MTHRPIASLPVQDPCAAKPPFAHQENVTYDRFRTILAPFAKGTITLGWSTPSGAPRLEWRATQKENKKRTFLLQPFSSCGNLSAMQHTSSTPLAAQAGAIAAAIRAEASHQALKAGMVAALHALILSALARLVARLENLVQLWQAGLLPPHPATPARRTNPPISAPLAAAPSTGLTPREPRARPPSAVRDSHVPHAIARRPASPVIIFSRVVPVSAPTARHLAPCRARPPDFSFFARHTPSPNCA